jgi:YidC/Oxa1 family membrane protein insertase
MFGFLAQLLAWCFDLVPNYAVAIALFTLIVMAAVTPFTIKGMRSAAEMSRIQPEMKKLQDQYKNDRVKQNEEMQKLFKEHGVNPLGGCLPMILPLPIFFIIFRLLRTLNARHNGVFAPLVRVLRHQIGGSAGYVSPHYLSYKASLTQHIISGNGIMKSFGVDLAATARQHHATVGEAIPYYALIVIMTISQYWQQRQINQRNPAAANANPQMKLTMQIFPAFYALISLSIPASVVLYLLLSGLYRMAQNSISYRFDPVLKVAPVPAVIDAGSRPAAGKAALGAGPPAKKGILASLREAADQAKGQQQNGGGRSAANGKGARPDRTERPARAAKPPKPDRPAIETPPPAPPASPPPSLPAKAQLDVPVDAPVDSPVDEPVDARPAPPSGGSPSPLSVRPSGRTTPPGSFGGRKRSKRRG